MATHLETILAELIQTRALPLVVHLAVIDTDAQMVILILGLTLMADGVLSKAQMHVKRFGAIQHLIEMVV